MIYPSGRVPVSPLPTRSRACRAPIPCHSTGKEPAMGHAPGFNSTDTEALEFASSDGGTRWHKMRPK